METKLWKQRLTDEVFILDEAVVFKIIPCQGSSRYIDMDRKSKGAVYHGECLPFMDGGMQANAPESSNGEYGNDDAKQS